MWALGQSGSLSSAALLYSSSYQCHSKELITQITQLWAANVSGEPLVSTGVFSHTSPPWTGVKTKDHWRTQMATAFSDQLIPAASLLLHCFYLKATVASCDAPSPCPPLTDGVEANDVVWFILWLNVIFRFRFFFFFLNGLRMDFYFEFLYTFLFLWPGFPCDFRSPRFPSSPVNSMEPAGSVSALETHTVAGVSCTTCEFPMRSFHTVCVSPRVTPPTPPPALTPPHPLVSTRPAAQ